MTNTAAEELFRQAAEAEGGMPVSAGAPGKAVFWFDLTPVPEAKRGALVAQIRELVSRASTPEQKTGSETFSTGERGS